MADVEDSGPLADPSRGCCCKRKATLRIIRTILHGVMVTILFSVSLFPYIYPRLSAVYIRKYNNVFLIIELVAYAAVACLYIYNSSSRQEKIFSAGYLVLVLSVFLISSIGIIKPNSSIGFIPYDSEIDRSEKDYIRNEFVFGANMVAIFTYCVWKLSFILPMLTNMVAISLPLRKIFATILHAGILAVIIVFYVVQKDTSKHTTNSLVIPTTNSLVIPVLIQLAAYNAVGCLYICSSSRQKEKVNCAGFLVVVLLVFLLSSLANSDLRISLIFAANIVAVSSYCIWKLYGLYHLLRRWFDALDGDVVPRDPARQEETVLQLQLTPFHIQEVLREFSSDEIRAMTQDFGSIIGQGGFAQVFRGNLGDGTAVAVKRMKANSGHTMAGEEDFRRELSIIASVHHRSLVRLLGYCLQRGGGLYLVYPFFENGSLDRWIFHGSEEQRRLLTWPKRRWIAVDVARALAYLHNECHRRILHLDVKPGNILLDGDLRAYVSDFGISLSITRGVPSIINTRGRGTLGYMALEMLFNSVSDRSDVFSYGKTLLELVGGRPNYIAPVSSADDASISSATPDLQRDYFPYIVRDMMTRGELMKAVDAAMAHDGMDEEEVKTVVEVALCCIQEQPDKRPRMQDVVDMLEGRVSVNLQPESRAPSAVNFLDSGSSFLS